MCPGGFLLSLCAADDNKKRGGAIQSEPFDRFDVVKKRRDDIRAGGEIEEMN